MTWMISNSLLHHHKRNRQGQPARHSKSDEFPVMPFWRIEGRRDGAVGWRSAVRAPNEWVTWNSSVMMMR